MGGKQGVNEVNKHLTFCVLPDYLTLLVYYTVVRTPLVQNYHFLKLLPHINLDLIEGHFKSIAVG